MLSVKRERRRLHHGAERVRRLPVLAKQTTLSAEKPHNSGMARDSAYATINVSILNKVGWEKGQGRTSDSSRAREEAVEVFDLERGIRARERVDCLIVVHAVPGTNQLVRSTDILQHLSIVWRTCGQVVV